MGLEITYETALTLIVMATILFGAAIFTFVNAENFTLWKDKTKKVSELNAKEANTAKSKGKN